MTPELQQWYEAQFNLFNEQGWKDLIEQVTQKTEELRQHQRYFNSRDVEVSSRPVVRLTGF